MARPSSRHDVTVHPRWLAIISRVNDVDTDEKSSRREGIGTGASSRTQGASHHLPHHGEDAHLPELHLGGVCDHFPGVRIGFLEAGGGWIAGWFDRMDRHFEDQGFNDSGLRLKSSEYFKRQCWISFESVEESLSVLADYIGPDKILWATDYPHPDGFFPGAPDLSAETKRKVLAQARGT